MAPYDKNQIRKTMFFHFAPGIPYKTIFPHYVIPEMDQFLLTQILEDKNITVISLGGFMETLLSIIAAEAIHFHCPRATLYWSGNTNEHDLVNASGLFKSKIKEFERIITEKFPVPIFIDKSGMHFFNPFFQYWKFNPILPGHRLKHRPGPPMKQVAANIMFPWDSRYLPTMRSLPVSEFKRQKQNITIIPTTGRSQHVFNCLPWSNTQIRAFSKLATQAGYGITILNPNKDNAFYGCGQVIPFNIQNLFACLTSSHTVLSCEYDYLFAALLVGGARIISRPIRMRYDFEETRIFLEKHNYIIYEEQIRDPVYCFEQHFR